ncbi:DUF2207 family protein [Facklamia languida]
MKELNKSQDRRSRMFGLFYQGILALLLVLGGMTGSLFAQESEAIQAPPHKTINVEIDSKGQTAIQLVFHYDKEAPHQVSVTLPTFSQKLLDYQVGVRTKDDSEIRMLQETSSGVMGSYQVDQGQKTAQVEVSYPFTEGSELVVDYALDQLALNYEDTAFWSGGWVLADMEEGDRLDLTVQLAQSVQSDKIQAWIHGQPGQIDRIQSTPQGSEIHLSVVYDPNQAQEIGLDLVFPRQATPDNPQQVKENRLTAIQDHENQRLADYQAQVKSDLMKRYLRFAMWLVFPILGTGVILYAYRRYAKQLLSPAPLIKSLHLPPEDLLATMVNPVVYQESLSAKELSAALLELGRKGYLKIVPVRMVRRSNSQTRSGYTLAISRVEGAPPLTLLQTYERQVYALFTDKTKETVTIEELVYQVKHHKKKKQACETAWTKFVNAIHLRIASLSPVRNRSKRRLVMACSVWLVISVIFLVILCYDSIAMNLTSALPWGIALALVNCLVLILVLIVIARQQFKTSEQALQQARWQELKRLFQCSDQLALEKYADIAQWEALIPYAIVLDATSTIQKSFTYQFDMADLQKVSNSQNADLYRVHGAIADILLPSVREFVTYIQPKTSQWKDFLKGKTYP